MNDQVAPRAQASAESVPAPSRGAASSHPGLDGTGLDGTGQPFLHDMVVAVYAPAMALSGSEGQIRAKGAEGLYVHDVRVISELVLSLDGAEPVGLQHDLVGGAASEFHAVAGGPTPGEPDPRVLVHRRREVNPKGMLERFTVCSYEPRAVACRAELVLACDFAGIAAVKQGLPTLPKAPRAEKNGFFWEIPGRCTARATGSPAPNALDLSAGLLAWALELAPRSSATFEISVEFEEPEALTPVGAAPPGSSELAPPKLEPGDHRLAKWVDLSVADLGQLRMVVPAHPEEVFVAAGVPWYLTLFGRDSIWASRMLLPLGTDVALGTLAALARRQGHADDPRTSEEPGKILHELRRSSSYDIDASGKRDNNYFGLPPVYYGSVDSTPLWVCLLHDAWLWGAPHDDIEALLRPMLGCLEWVAQRGCDGRGFVSYVDASGKGLANQGWKDSGDAVQYRDGRLAKGPVALCEVQGYAYEAALGGAELLDAFGMTGAERWREFAAGLEKRFRARFWVDDAGGPYPAIALDGGGEVVDSLTSNIGHLLGTGILNAEESELVARRLAGPELASAFGLRTLSTSSRGFNPLSYHCGSVWAHDTAIAITGLARTSAPSAELAAGRLAKGLLAAAEGFSYRVPELYGGEEGSGLAAPVPYPASCHPQAWAAGASIAVLASLLRLQPDVPRRRVRLAPMAAGRSLRSVNGLFIAGKRVTLQGASDGTVKLRGLPRGFDVVA